MEKQWKTTTEKQDGITTTTVEPIPQPENQQEIATLAYEFWQTRGCPDGSPEEDWFRAERELQGRRERRLKAA